MIIVFLIRMFLWFILEKYAVVDTCERSFST